MESCTILTTQANDLLASLHDRMPVILGPADYDRWLDHNATDPQALVFLLDACPAEDVIVEAASPRVNNVANDDSGILEPPRLLFD